MLAQGGGVWWRADPADEVEGLDDDERVPATVPAAVGDQVGEVPQLTERYAELGDQLLVHHPRVLRGAVEVGAVGEHREDLDGEGVRGEQGDAVVPQQFRELDALPEPGGAPRLPD